MKGLAQPPAVGPAAPVGGHPFPQVAQPSRCPWTMFSLFLSPLSLPIAVHSAFPILVCFPVGGVSCVAVPALPRFFLPLVEKES